MMNLLHHLSLFFSLASLVSAVVDIGNGFIAESEVILPGYGSGLGTAPDGYKAVPLRWFGQVLPGGPNITVVGANLHHINQYLNGLNPQYAEVATKQVAKRQLEKRYEWHILCNRDNFAGENYYGEGIEYLQENSGWCIVDGGQGSCNRCSCSYNSGIWMCNDSPSVTHQYMYCSDMGNQAALVSNDCDPNSGAQTDLQWNGQWFRHDTQYSVLLAGTDPDSC